MFAARNELQATLEPAEVVVLDEAINALLASTEVDVDEWLRTLPLDDQAKRTLDATVTEGLLDRRFAVDATVTRKRLAKRRFKGDHGLQVVVNTDDFGKVVQEPVLVREAGKPPYFVVTLHTEKWEEVK